MKTKNMLRAIAKTIGPKPRMRYLFNLRKKTPDYRNMTFKNGPWRT